MSPILSIHTEEFDLVLNEIAADDCVREDTIWAYVAEAPICCTTSLYVVVSPLPALVDLL